MRRGEVSPQKYLQPQIVSMGEGVRVREEEGGSNPGARPRAPRTAECSLPSTAPGPGPLGGVRGPRGAMEEHLIRGGGWR